LFGITERVECTEYIRDAQGCAHWSKKSDGKKYLGRPGLRENNTEMELKKQSRWAWTGFCEHSNEQSRSFKFVILLGCLRDYYFAKKYSAS